MTKKDRERRYDRSGPIVKMAEADNYVMIRRPRCSPTVLFTKDWKLLSTEPVSHDDRQAPLLHMERVYG